MSIRKFKEGPLFENAISAFEFILGGGWCYLGTSKRPKHPRVMDKMTMEVIANSARNGNLRRAVRIDQ